jgi:hypothetical protein
MLYTHMRAQGERERERKRERLIVVTTAFLSIRHIVQDLTQKPVRGGALQM